MGTAIVVAAAAAGSVVLLPITKVVVAPPPIDTSSAVISGDWTGWLIQNIEWWLICGVTLWVCGCMVDCLSLCSVSVSRPVSHQLVGGNLIKIYRLYYLFIRTANILCSCGGRDGELVERRLKSFLIIIV